MKKTAFRRRLQRPRVNKKIATVNRADAAVKKAILGADRSNQKQNPYDLISLKLQNLHATALKPFSNFASVFEYLTISHVYGTSMVSLIHSRQRPIR